jgi:CubicO group peptidase (beta-lactamase class C family)
MDTNQLDAFVFEKMAATRLPGLAMVVVKGGDVLHARGYGLADIARARPVTTDTLFGAASITKSFVAIALLQLAEQGKLKLDDPVDRYLTWPIRTNGPRVTLAHLLAHTCGTPALGYIEAVLRHAHDIGGTPLPIGKPADVVPFMHGADDWNEAAPGERWFYFNEGYVLLGEIIRGVSGQPYDQYIREHILAPLGMSRSFFDEPAVAGDDNVATPYVLPQDGQPRPGRYLHGVLGGDAALITTANDLARYVSMFLKRGRGVMSQTSYESMIAPRIALPSTPVPSLLGESAPGEPGSYGYGVSVIDDFFGEPLIGHGGNLIVATSHFAFMPKRQVGVAIVANGNGYPTSQLARVALAIAIGKDPQTLSFVRMDKALNDLTGMYETFRGTVKAKLVRAGDFLRLEYLCGDQSPAPTLMVPERVDSDAPRFFTYAEGARQLIEFRKTKEGIELIHERYKFERTGPLN